MAANESRDLVVTINYYRPCHKYVRQVWLTLVKTYRKFHVQVNIHSLTSVIGLFDHSKAKGPWTHSKRLHNFNSGLATNVKVGHSIIHSQLECTDSNKHCFGNSLPNHAIKWLSRSGSIFSHANFRYVFQNIELNMTYSCHSLLKLACTSGSYTNKK